MALRYASTAEVKDVLGKEWHGDDTILTMFLDGASRFIEGHTGRRFDKQTGVVRYFDGTGGRRLLVGDVLSVTEVASGTWAGTYTTYSAGTWYLGPSNPAYGWPYQWLERPYSVAGYDPIVNGYGEVFALGHRTVRVTGTFGWEAVPEDIRNVCVSLAARAWKAARAGFNDAIGVDAAGAPVFSKALTTMDAKVLAHYAGARMVFV